MPGEFRIRPVPGIGEVRAGDDLAALIENASTAADIRLGHGDIVVVASKVVSKAEGRVRHGLDREAAVHAETARVVATRGRTRIVQTRHGFVMAAAGVDESNVEPGSVVLLPLDPDGSARALRAELARRTGAQLGVLITDTFGRPWRQGQTDLAIGAAGVLVLDEHAGRTDAYGNPLLVTAPALADELAAAADLAKPKLSGVPVAVVSGLQQLVTRQDGPGVAIQVRPAEEDMFRLGTREAMASAATLPRSTPRLTGRAPDQERIEQVLATVLDTIERRESGIGEPPWTLNHWRQPDRRERALRALALDEAAPYLLAVEGRNDDQSTAALLELGALLDRFAVALIAEGFGVRRASEAELRTLRDAATTDSLLALLAIGIPESSEPATAPKDRTDQKER